MKATNVVNLHTGMSLKSKCNFKSPMICMHCLVGYWIYTETHICYYTKNCLFIFRYLYDSCSWFDFYYSEVYGFKNILRSGPQASLDSQRGSGAPKCLGGSLWYSWGTAWKEPGAQGQEPSYYVNIYPGLLCEQKVTSVVLIGRFIVTRAYPI